MSWNRAWNVTDVPVYAEVILSPFGGAFRRIVQVRGLYFAGCAIVMGSRYQLFLLAAVLTLSSCKTYYIPLDSFRAQFAGMDPAQFETVKVRGPLNEVYEYRTFPRKPIQCVTKKGEPYQLEPSPALEIRFTMNNGKRTVFYFDKMLVTDSTVKGEQSRFIENLTKTIPLNSISKIEIQNGRKRFSYVN